MFCPNNTVDWFRRCVAYCTTWICFLRRFWLALITFWETLGKNFLYIYIYRKTKKFQSLKFGKPTGKTKPVATNEKEIMQRITSQTQKSDMTYANALKRHQPTTSNNSRPLNFINVNNINQNSWIASAFSSKLRVQLKSNQQGLLNFFYFPQHLCKCSTIRRRFRAIMYDAILLINGQGVFQRKITGENIVSWRLKTRQRSTTDQSQKERPRKTPGMVKILQRPKQILEEPETLKDVRAATYEEIQKRNR